MSTYSNIIDPVKGCIAKDTVMLWFIRNCYYFQVHIRFTSALSITIVVTWYHYCNYSPSRIILFFFGWSQTCKTCRIRIVLVYVALILSIYDPF